MTPAKPPTQGPTIPCPVCGVLVRSVYNPHATTYTVYHGEDQLLTMQITDGPPLTDAEVGQAADMLLAGTIAQVATLHGIAA